MSDEDRVKTLRAEAKSHLQASADAKDKNVAEREWNRWQELSDEAEDLRLKLKFKLTENT